MSPTSLADRASPTWRVFDRAEFDHRLAAVKYRMAADGIDVMLVSDPANMNYLTGYDGWSFYVPQVVIVALDHDNPVWIGRHMDANGARWTTVLPPDDILGYPDHYVQQRHIHPMTFVAEEITRRGWHKGRLAVEMDAYYFSVQGWESLRAGLPNATFKDAGHLVNWVRAVKSDAEIGLMRRAARILESAMQTACEGVEPGRRQCDTVAEIMSAQVRGTPEFGGDYTAIVPMLPTGICSSTPHLTWTDETFKAGEATILELAAANRRYHCAMARTVYLGKPPALMVDTAEVVCEGLQAALDAARPGATCEEVEHAWREATRRHGLVKESRIGYSIGCAYPPDWGEHTMSLRPGDTTVLQPNMTFHLIPGIWMEDWGIELSETFLVTERGGEPLCGLPRGLYVKQ